MLSFLHRKVKELLKQLDFAVFSKNDLNRNLLVFAFSASRFSEPFVVAGQYSMLASMLTNNNTLSNS